jgi:hypothetical protein
MRKQKEPDPPLKVNRSFIEGPESEENYQRALDMLMRIDLDDDPPEEEEN